MVFFMNAVGDGLWDMNVESGDVIINNEMMRLIGLESQHLTFDKVVDRVHKADRQSFIREMTGLIEGKVDLYKNEFRMMVNDDGFVWIEDRGCAVEKNGMGKVVRVVGVSRDITERRSMEEALELQKQRYKELSYNDWLTGSHNRRAFELMLPIYADESKLPLTILSGDINDLKTVNDAFGHEEGDNVIRYLANAFEEVIGGDSGFVCRWAGDAFLALLPKVTIDGSTNIIDNIRVAFNKRIKGPFKPSISFGYSTMTSPSQNISEILREAEDMVYDVKFLEKGSRKGQIIDVLLQTLYEKNEREESHSKNVSKIAMLMAKAMELGELEVQMYEAAGLLHDIGKTGVDNDILEKKESLTEAEWYSVKRHSEVGYRILMASSKFTNIADAVLYHHERPDGYGYPKGLSGNEIPILAKVIGIADAYDAMSSIRPYRERLSHDEIIGELKKKDLVYNLTVNSYEYF